MLSLIIIFRKRNALTTLIEESSINDPNDNNANQFELEVTAEDSYEEYVNQSRSMLNEELLTDIYLKACFNSLNVNFLQSIFYFRV